MLRQLMVLLIASLLVGWSGANAYALAAFFHGPALQEKTEDEKKQEDKEDSEGEEEEEKVDPAVEAFEKLEKDGRDAQRDFIKKLRSADEAEQMELFKSGGPRKGFASKYLAYAKKYSGSENEFKAVSFAAQNGDDDTVKEAMEIIVEKFSDRKELGTFLQRFDRTVQFPSEVHMNFLDTLVKKSSEDSIKGSAEYARYSLLKGVPEMQEMLGSDESMKDMVPASTQEFLKMETGKEFDAKLEGMLSDIAEKYADVKLGRSTLGELAEGELFVIKQLTVGKVAPNIEGIDLDGEDFKLSDYRGKVVLLDFWGDW